MTTYTRAMRGLLRRLTAVNVTNRGFDASRDPRSTFRVIPDDELYVGGDEGFVGDTGSPFPVPRSSMGVWRDIPLTDEPGDLATARLANWVYDLVRRELVVEGSKGGEADGPKAQ